MKAARIHRFGGDVSIDDVDEPAPGDGEALVRLAAVAVNPLDLWVAEGSVAGGSQRLPFVLGTEGVGDVGGRLVIVNGAGVGTVRDGLLREAAAVPATALVDLPNGIDATQAAALSIAGITAKRVLDVGGVEAGTIVVVLGASGGVGAIAVQAARILGAKVVAVSGDPAKREWLERFEPELVLAGLDAGAAEAITERFGRLAEVVLDPLGGAFCGAATDVLGPRGRHVLYGRSSSDTATFGVSAFYRKNLSLLGYGGLDDDAGLKRAALEWIVAKIGTGEIAIPVELELPLSRAGEALEAIRERRVRGKAIVRIGS